MIQIIYGDVAIGAAENAQYTDTGKQEYSTLSELSFGASPALIATGEVGRWKLDGSVDVIGYPTCDYGYISDTLSNSTGKYDGDTGLDVCFTSLYASSGLTVTFDPLEDVFYTFTVQWYQNETLLDTKTYTSTSAEYVIENAVNLYNKISIRFTQSSVPYRYARISKIMYGVGRRFSSSDFDSASLTQQVNPISEELAIDTSRFSLRPKRNIDFLFQSRQTFRIYRDTALIAAHYLKEANVTSKNNYALSCQSAVGLLDEQQISAKMYTNTSAEVIAHDILDGVFDFDMDDELKDVALTGYYSDGSRRYALQQLLFAIGARCTTAASEKIRIFVPPTATKSIPRENIYTGATVERNTHVTAVKLEYHSYSSTKTANSKEIKIGDTSYYDTVGTVEKSNPDVISDTPENIVTLQGVTFVDKTRADALIDTVFDYFVNNSVISEKILVSDECTGDRVLTEDILGKAFEGDIVSYEVALSNTFAAKIKVRGKYL